MRPKRRKFELALVDIRRCLVDPPVEDRIDALPWAAYQIGRFVKVLASDPERNRALIDTVRAVRESPGPGSTVAETDLMKALSSIAYWCADEMAEGPPLDAHSGQELLGATGARRRASQILTTGGMLYAAHTSAGNTGPQPIANA